MLTSGDLAAAIEELTGLLPVLSLRKEAAGTRPCPHCRAAMTSAHLTIELEGTRPAKPDVELDHCPAHGLWFDESELAFVLAPVAGKGFGGGAASATSALDRQGNAPRSFSFKIGGRGWGL